MAIGQYLEIVDGIRSAAVVSAGVAERVRHPAAPEPCKASLQRQIEAVVLGAAAVIEPRVDAARECRDAQLAGKAQQIGADDRSRPARIDAQGGVQIVADPTLALVVDVIGSDRCGLPELALVPG